MVCLHEQAFFHKWLPPSPWSPRLARTRLQTFFYCKKDVIFLLLSHNDRIIAIQLPRDWACLPARAGGPAARLQPLLARLPADTLQISPNAINEICHNKQLPAIGIKVFASRRNGDIFKSSPGREILRISWCVFCISLNKENPKKGRTALGAPKDFEPHLR